MNGIERLLETVKAVVEAHVRGDSGYVSHLLPRLEEELETFEQEHFPDGLPVAESTDA